MLYYMQIELLTIAFPFSRINALNVSFTFSSLRRFQLNGIISKLKKKYLIINNSPKQTTYGRIEISDVIPTLTMVAGSMVLALLILVIEKVHYSFKIRSENKLFIKKLNYNLSVRNRLRKGNNNRNLRLPEFNNTRLIGYWP